MGPCAVLRIASRHGMPHLPRLVSNYFTSTVNKHHSIAIRNNSAIEPLSQSNSCATTAALFERNNQLAANIAE
jgi:hypothetical protein